jgi:response regulator RpfG family c-di-GMP phosphodiesterase
MSLTSSYILLLANQPSYEFRFLVSLLGNSEYAVAIADSEEQAVTVTQAHSPFLIILAGDLHRWSDQLLGQLRTCANTCRQITLVALTDFHAPSWLPQEDNPGFDGFLVSPISNEVLSSLVEAAHTRQYCPMKGG